MIAIRLLKLKLELNNAKNWNELKLIVLVHVIVHVI